MLMWYIYQYKPWWCLFWAAFSSYFGSELVVLNRQSQMVVNRVKLLESGDEVVLEMVNKDIKQVKIEDIKTDGEVTGINLYALKRLHGDFTRLTDGTQVFLIDHNGDYHNAGVMKAISVGTPIDTS